MSRRGARLAAIQRIAGMRENQAAKAWGEARQAEQAVRQQLDTLERYLHDYRENYHRARTAGLEVSRLIEYQRFIARLEAAIGEQRELLKQHRARSEQRRDQWQGRYTSRGALDKVAERIAHEEQARAQRREQRELDDRPWKPGRDD